MTVVKSFELKGNKLSFANWISNLSPTDTPFTSMIGKEKIDQTQYSWQTDSLAPASAETFAEGSQATMQPRASTSVFTNFTSLLRKGVKVTDTNQATDAYGRRDELAYQVGKAGKELVRDVEYMNLSPDTGNPGDARTASRHNGFKNLCAPMFMPDPDTFAITHRGVAVVDDKKPWFALKDIFKVTTDLYLAGSKADKIMFHPRHMNIFSDLLGYNEEEPLMYRLFDNLDTKYNMNVAKIKDPLGRLYTLVPNRNMPIGEVYFFNEADWTQMVLQAPVQKKLARKGSSDALIVETEIGLRHRHPYASGVLHLFVIDYITTLTTDENTLTAFVGDQANLEFTATDTTGAVADGVRVKFTSSDEKGVELSSTEEATGANGEVSIQVTAISPCRTAIYAHYEDTDKNLLTEPVIINVVPPSTVFSIAGGEAPQAMKQSTMTVLLQKANGTPIANRKTYIHADEGNTKAGLAGNEFTTDANGVATVNFTPAEVGRLNFRLSLSTSDDAWQSFPYQVEVVDNDIKIFFAPGTESVLTKFVDGTQSVAIHVTDGGNPVSGANVKVESYNDTVVNFTANEYATNASGVATTQMSIVDYGKSTIKATYLNKTVAVDMYVESGTLQLTTDKNVMEVGDDTGAILVAQVIKANGEPAEKSGIQITWGTEPDDLNITINDNSSLTNGDGQATTTVVGNFEPAKGKVKAYWVDAEEFGSVDIEIIPTQYKIEFNQPEITVVGGLGDSFDIPVKISHEWAEVDGHTLDFFSSNSNFVNWTNKEGRTDHSGYVTPANSITADDFGTVTLTVTGVESETEHYVSGTATVHSVKPVISFATDSSVLLEGDTGQVTITMETPSGSVISGYQGSVTILTDRSKIEPTTNTVSFGGGSRATFSFTAVGLGESEINFALPDGTNLPVKGRNTVEVVTPSITVTTIPEQYKSGEHVQIVAHLSKPVGSAASLFDKEITFTSEPELPGLDGGRKIKTDNSGAARISTSAIGGNSDYTITAAFNGVSATYDLEPETP